MTDERQTTLVLDKAAMAHRFLQAVGAWCAGAVCAAAFVLAYWDGYNDVSRWRSLALLLAGGLLTSLVLVVKSAPVIHCPAELPEQANEP
jgi:hypothetical protein